VLYTQSHRASPTPTATARSKVAGPTDKFANYSTATQLGLAEEEEATQESSYEIEQMVRNRPTHVGAWEEVAVEPQGAYSGDGLKRKLEEEEEEGEGWKFAHAGKKPVHDPYAEEEWDPKAALKARNKIKAEAESSFTPQGFAGEDLKREQWSGRLELKTAEETRKKRAQGLMYQEGGGWIKTEQEEAAGTSAAEAQPSGSETQSPKDVKPDLSLLAPAADNLSSAVPKTEGEEDKLGTQPGPAPEVAEPAASSLFKKRRPPPSSRKK
jgi:WW domain-binding protein 4